MSSPNDCFHLTVERIEGEPPASTWADGTRGVVLVRATPVK